MVVGRYHSLGMQGGGGVVVANWGLGASTPLMVLFLEENEKTPHTPHTP